MHDIVIVGIELVVILAGIIFRHNDFKGTRSGLGGLRDQFSKDHAEVLGRLESINADMRQFYRQ